MRLAGFAAALLLAFAAAFGAGRLAGPTGRAAAAEPAMDHDAMPQGLAVAAGDLRLDADVSGFTPDVRRDLRFRIADRSGATVRDFAVEHEKRLHLIAVRRDLTGFQHVHPVQQADGSWSVPLRFGVPGTYRVFADFTPAGGERTTLGTDLTVPGAATAEPLPAPSGRVGTDGYDVAIAPAAGGVAFRVTRDGRPVATERYLGAAGHLVVLREGDLAYLHAHADEDALRFGVDYPSAGRYRLFLQFQAGGRVHTAAFTREAR